MKSASFTPDDAGTSTSPLARRSLLLVVFTGLVGLAPLPAATLAFQRVTDNSPVDLSTDLTVVVTDLGGGLALFSVNRGTEYEAFLRNVYFEDVGDSLGTITFAPDLSTAGIEMDDPSRPPGPPGLPSFVVDTSFDAEPPGPKNGIGDGESGGFVAEYNGSYQDLLAALEAGTVRIAVHAQGIASPKDGPDDCVWHPGDKQDDDRYEDDHSPYQGEGGRGHGYSKKGGYGGDDHHHDGCAKGDESDTYVTIAIPEPSSLVLLCLASLGLLRRVRR